jgi:hypothetical protein
MSNGGGPYNRTIAAQYNQCAANRGAHCMRFVTGIGLKQPIHASAEHQITYRVLGPCGRLGLGEETGFEDRDDRCREILVCPILCVRREKALVHSG